MSKPNTRELSLDGNSLVYTNPGNYSALVEKWPLSKPENLVHKHTPDHEYHVVYDKTGIHVDVFKTQLINHKHDDGYHWNTKHVAVFKRDTYYQHEFFVEFAYVDATWYLVINREFSKLSVYKMPDCTLVHDVPTASEFLGRVRPLNCDVRGRYFIAFGWIWGPIENTYTFDLHDIVAGKSSTPLVEKGHKIDNLFSEDWTVDVAKIVNAIVSLGPDPDGTMRFKFDPTGHDFKFDESDSEADSIS